MTSMVIADRSLLPELLRSMRKALPAAVWRGVRGSVQTVVLAEAPSGRRHRTSQLVDVVVSSDLVLRRRIVVPLKARKEVAHAINLFIQTETPFAPADVLVHAFEDAARPSDHQVAYSVRLLPKAALRQALTARGLRERQVGRLVVEGAEDVDFAPALFPARRYTRWLPALPVALVLVSLAMLGTYELSQRNLHIAELEAEVGQTLGRIKAMTAETDAVRQQASGATAAFALLRDTPPVFTTLETIRKFLPNTTELLRVDIRGAETRLAVRSPNALSDVQGLSDARTGWSGSIEGAITADPSSNLEMASILLRPRAVDAN